jgi:hypothetical protein
MLSIRSFLVVLLLCVCTSLYSQESTGRITGTITDPAGAAVAGAKVTVTNAGTGVHHTIVSGPDGNYQVLDLPIGNYTVTVEHPGFTTIVTKNSELTINQTLRVDVAMKLGSVSETISVESQAAQVETASAVLGGTVTGATITNLPLNGRNTLDLTLTQPGVVPANTQSTVAGNFTIGGGRPDEILFLLDGGNNNTVAYSGVSVNPNPDTIAEFRVLANNYSAEFGHAGGGVISVVTKSGSNTVHGSAYDYLRNDDLNANLYFNNAAAATNPNGQANPRPILKRNQFGGTIGGPVSIPKVVHGRDKLFFFFAYQGQRQHATQSSGTVQVFTPEQLTGDFSHAVNNRPDTSVANFLLKNPYFQSNPSLASQAIIDPARLDPVAQNYIKAGLIPSAPSGILIPQAAAINNSNEYTGKGDYYASASDRISVTLAYNKNPSINPFSASLPGYPVQNLYRQEYGNLAYTKVISPTLLNELHVTANHYDFYKNTPAADEPLFPSLGIRANTDGATGPTNLSWNTAGSIGFNSNNGRTSDTVYSYSDSLTWTRGRHNVKAGFIFSAAENNAFYLFGTNGSFSFTTTFAGGSGNDRANFLLGLPATFNMTPGAFSNARTKEYGAFAQDEWKMTPHLTLTLGIRYEYNTPLTDPYRRTLSYMPGVQSKVFTNAPLGVVFPGDPGAPRGQYFPDHKAWQPRIGFAWDPFGNGRTSIRGGFGVFLDALRAESVQWNNGSPPFYSAASLAFSQTAPVGLTGPLNNLSNPYAATGSIDPFPSTPPPANLNWATKGFLPAIAGIGAWVDPFLRLPYIFQYNLTLQHQLAHGLVMEVGYAGNDTHGLLELVDINPTIIGSRDPVQANASIRVQNTLPGVAPQTFRNMNQIQNLGKSNYNGLLTSLTKRMGDTRGLGAMFFTVSYTWSHAIDNGSGWQQASSAVPAYNHNAFRANSDFDTRQRFVLSGGWELPFAKLGGPRKLTGGWTLYPILSDTAGLPFTISAGATATTRWGPGPSGDGTPGEVHPNLTTNGVPIYSASLVQTLQVPTSTSNPTPVPRSGHFYFNPNDFTVPAQWLSVAYNPTAAQVTYGQLGRNSIAGPGIFNFDLSLEKRTSFFGERLNTAFRAEFFNILNHAEYNSPTTSINSNLFGLITSTRDPRIGQVALRLTF